MLTREIDTTDTLRIVLLAPTVHDGVVVLPAKSGLPFPIDMDEAMARSLIQRGKARLATEDE